MPENTVDATLASPSETTPYVLPVYGLPGYRFYLIHCTAVVALSIGISCSAGTLLYLNYPCTSNFFARTIGERLVVYLAFCDLMFSISHMMDHASMLAEVGFPPDAACKAFAFFLNEFVLAQSLIVSFTALNAYLMVIKGIRINLGRYDWKLTSVAFGFPLIFGIAAEAAGLFGPTGPMCYVNLGNPNGPIASLAITMLLIGTLVLNLACYVTVLAKMRAVEKRLHQGSSQHPQQQQQQQQQSSVDNSNSTKYHSVARIMMLFVLVYLLQYWSYAIFSVWVSFGEPYIVIVWSAIFFTNLGGIFNMVAYTVVRRRLRSVQPEIRVVAVMPLTTGTTGVVKF